MITNTRTLPKSLKIQSKKNLLNLKKNYIRNIQLKKDEPKRIQDFLNQSNLLTLSEI
jgi:hypothetical protein